MRLFIACQFSREALQEIERVRDELRRHAEKGNFTRSENFHLTLAFLGKIGEEKIDCIKWCMKQSAGPDFNMKLRGMGCFPQKDGGLYWMGVQAPPELYALRENLYRLLRQEGFCLDTRPFRPHITLGRRIRMDQPTKTIRMVPIISHVNHIFLMQSQRIHDKLVYKEIWKTPLGLKDGPEQR